MKVNVATVILAVIFQNLNLLKIINNISNETLKKADIVPVNPQGRLEFPLPAIWFIPNLCLRYNKHSG